MLGKDLMKLCEKYPDFDFEFSFTDGNNGRFINVRHFEKLELCDVGHSDKVVILSGEER